MFEIIGKSSLYILSTLLIGGLATLFPDCDDAGVMFFAAWLTGYFIFMTLITL